MVDVSVYSTMINQADVVSSNELNLSLFTMGAADALELTASFPQTCFNEQTS
jgi:hypothetical protein